MLSSLVSICGVLAALPGDHLVVADFAADCAPFVASAALTCDGGSAAIPAGTTTVLRTDSLVLGDVSIDLAFAEPWAGDLVLRLLGSPDLEIRLGATARFLRSDAKQVDVEAAPTPCRALRVTLRSNSAEVLLDGQPYGFADFTRPLGGGGLELEFTPSAPAKLDAVTVSRLVFPDRDVVEGLDGERLLRLSALPLDAFTLLDAAVARIDPVYRIGVKGESDPIVVRGRGVRPDAAELPLLEQALAFARIRPWLKVDLIDGEAEAEDRPLERQGADGPYVITKAPGVIRVRALCGIVDQQPVVVVTNTTRDRVLVRFNPSGPSVGEAWSTIPPKCDRMRFALVVPGGGTVERFVDVVRS